MQIAGLDIGGAGLKIADLSGRAASRRFPLYRQPELLAEELRSLVLPFEPDFVAVTMTGELCDCFETKSHGVRAILQAVRELPIADEAISVWQTSGRFVGLDCAMCDSWATSASNWSALAAYSTRFCDNWPSLLIDIGSTTTDIIPIRDGMPVPLGFDDPGRLSSGELVYSGVERTPIFALLQEVSLGQYRYRTAAEYFATSLDVYLLLGDMDEDPEHRNTADGRPATIEAAIDRIARVIGSDRSRFFAEDAREVARQFRKKQVEQLSNAVSEVVTRSFENGVKQLIAVGQGEFLIRQIMDANLLLSEATSFSFSRELGATLSCSACAYAVAVLLNESFHGRERS